MIKGKKVAKKTSLPDIGGIFRWQYGDEWVYHIVISKSTDIGLNNTSDHSININHIQHWTDWSMAIEFIESLDERRDE